MRALPQSRSARSAKPGAALRRAAALGLCVLGLAALPAAPAAAVDSDGIVDVANKTFDALLLRPLNAAAVVVGAGFFAVTAPLVAPSGEIATAFDVFVYAPYEYAFQRPLGDF